MIKLLQWQSTLSNPNQIRVDGGANFHVFWYKNLFYISFVRPTPVQVSGRSTFSAASVGLVSVKLPGWHILHSLASSYWTSQTAQTPSTLAPSRCMVSSLLLPMNLSNPAPSATPKAAFSPSVPIEKKLDYINIHLVKKDQSQPNGPHRCISPIIMIMGHNLSDKSIHQRFGHASYKHIQNMSKLGI